MLDAQDRDAHGERSPLRHGLGAAAAVDVLFAIGSPETYRLVVVDRGWWRTDSNAGTPTRWRDSCWLTMPSPPPGSADRGRGAPQEPGGVVEVGVTAVHPGWPEGLPSRWRTASRRPAWTAWLTSATWASASLGPGAGPLGQAGAVVPAAGSRRTGYARRPRG